jgi:hypothetical protein
MTARQTHNQILDEKLWQNLMRCQNIYNMQVTCVMHEVMPTKCALSNRMVGLSSLRSRSSFFTFV